VLVPTPRGSRARECQRHTHPLQVRKEPASSGRKASRRASVSCFPYIWLLLLCPQAARRQAEGGHYPSQVLHVRRTIWCMMSLKWPSRRASRGELISARSSIKHERGSGVCHVSPSSPLRARRKQGLPCPVSQRILRALREGPGYTTELASRAGASLFWSREVLRQLEAEGLVRAWTFALADYGGRCLTVRAWRLTTAEERSSGREDPNASARASAALSRMLRERLERVKRANDCLVQEARKDREARLSSS